jgi:hypothetical protein
MSTELPDARLTALAAANATVFTDTNTSDLTTILGEFTGYADQSGTLAQFASTTSLQLKTLLSDETGSGAAVFGTSPTLVTPDLGTPSALVATNATGTAAGLTVGATTGVEAGADVTDATNVTAAGALMDSEVTNLAQVKAFSSADYATAAQGTTADAALPKTGGAMTGAITTNSTFDGRDVATDGTKLDGIEALADVTDATNVTSSGALMDSELASIASVKALNQGVATTDSPTFVGETLSGLTASEMVITTAGKALASAAVATYPSLAELAYVKGLTSAAQTQITALKAGSIGITIDGAGSAITTGVKGYLEIPFDYTITQATLTADQSGSIVVDVWKDTYANYPPTDLDSITASAPPTITAAVKSQDSTLTGWTLTGAKGDVLGFNVDSITTITRATLTLQVTKT